MSRRAIFGALLLGLLVEADPARAALVTWEFEAIVRGTRGTPGHVGDPVLFHTGQMLQGSLTFDTATPDSETASGAGRYTGAEVAFRADYLVGFEPVPPGPFVLGLAAAPGNVFASNLSSLDRYSLDAPLDPSTFDTSAALERRCGTSRSASRHSLRSPS